MANNKVQLADGTTLIDLTSDTVTPQTLVAPATAHASNGEQITGVVNLANAGDAIPLADSVSGAAGSSTEYAREDHVHPLSNDLSNLITIAKYNISGVLTCPISGARLYRKILKKVGPVVTFSCDIEGLNQSLYDVDILSMPEGFRPFAAIYIMGGFETQVEESVEHTNNLFNGAKVTDGQTIAYSTGGTTTRNGISLTGYIPVLPNTQYKLSAVLGSGTYGTCFYDRSQTYLGGVPSNADNQTFTTPWNCEYIRVPISTSGKSSFTIHKIEQMLINKLIYAPIAIATNGVVTAYAPTGYTYTKVLLAGSYGYQLTT